MFDVSKSSNHTDNTFYSQKSNNRIHYELQSKLQRQITLPANVRNHWTRKPNTVASFVCKIHQSSLEIIWHPNLYFAFHRSRCASKSVRYLASFSRRIRFTSLSLIISMRRFGFSHRTSQSASPARIKANNSKALPTELVSLYVAPLKAE